MSRRLLQLLTGLVALLTVALGAIQAGLGIRSPLYAGLALPAAPVLDSNLRFLGGLGIGLGLLLLWITPTIERHGRIFAAVWLCTFLGGVGRALSWLALGTPPARLVGFTLLEVAGAPLFILWQRRVATRRSPPP